MMKVALPVDLNVQDLDALSEILRRKMKDAPADEARILDLNDIIACKNPRFPFVE